MSPDQNEIVVDFNFKEIKNNEAGEEAKPKPKAKRASKTNNIVVEDDKKQSFLSLTSRRDVDINPDPVELVKVKPKPKRTI